MLMECSMDKFMPGDHLSFFFWFLLTIWITSSYFNIIFDIQKLSECHLMKTHIFVYINSQW